MISGAHTRKQLWLLGGEQEGRGGVTNTDELSWKAQPSLQKHGKLLSSALDILSAVSDENHCTTVTCEHNLPALVCSIASS